MERKMNMDMPQDEFIHELYKQMFIVAYGRVRDKAEALDIVQESWVKILNKIDTLKDADKIISWAKVIVSNTALNSLKKKRTSAEILFHDEHVVREIHSEYYNLEEHVLMDELYEELQKLDLETRKIFLYKFLYGWKDQQIADKMDMPAGTVKARIHRAKDKLRKVLIQ